MKSGTITNPEYQRMLMRDTLQDHIDYLDWMIDFYFKVTVAMRPVGFKSMFRMEMSHGVQMMFTKAKSFRKLLDGFGHSDGVNTLNCITDHTVLFTFVRAAYEQLCAFELVCIIPDTAEKKLVLENIYIASGLTSRHKLFTEDALERNKEVLREEELIIADCKNAIVNTNLYNGLTEREQTNLLKCIDKGEYQVVFSEDKMTPHVGWDEVRDYIGLDTDVLKGLYKYACNMAHPSYLGLIQYIEAFKDDAMTHLKETAIMQFISIMSVYIGDYMKAFPECVHVYNNLDDESKFMVDMYKDGFREKSKNQSSSFCL